MPGGVNGVEQLQLNAVRTGRSVSNGRAPASPRAGFFKPPMHTDGHGWICFHAFFYPCESVCIRGSQFFFYIGSERSSPEQLEPRNKVGAAMILPVSRRRHGTAGHAGCPRCDGDRDGRRYLHRGRPRTPPPAYRSLYISRIEYTQSSSPAKGRCLSLLRRRGSFLEKPPP